MSKTIFACTRIKKITQKHSVDEGCGHDESRCTSSRSVNITGESMQELIKNISRELFLDCENESWSFSSKYGEANFISFRRIENDEGDKSTTRQDAQWEAGVINLWMADYFFYIEKQDVSCIEKRVVSPVSPEDLQGVKFHE